MMALIEQVLVTSGKAYAFVRFQEGKDLTLTEKATLAGLPIEQWLDQPRKLKADGSLGTGLFVLALRFVGDAGKLAAGSSVELNP